MPTSLVNGAYVNVPARATMPIRYGRPDYQLAEALTKVSPQAQAKAKATSQDFEAVFLNSMISQMTSGIKGEGPFGETTGTGVWRSMLTEQYSKNFAKAGGIGIAVLAGMLPMVELIRLLAITSPRCRPGSRRRP